MSRLPWPPAVADVALEEAIEVQAIKWLKADPSLTALVAGRIYTHVPPATPFPLIRIEAFVPAPWHRLRGYGRAVSFTLRAQSQVKGDYEVHRIANRIIQVLTDRSEPLPPFRRARWSHEASPTTYADELAGVVTYHRPTIVRVEVTI